MYGHKGPHNGHIQVEESEVPCDVTQACAVEGPSSFGCHGPMPSWWVPGTCAMAPLAVACHNSTMTPGCRLRLVQLSGVGKGSPRRRVCLCEDGGCRGPRNFLLPGAVLLSP